MPRPRQIKEVDIALNSKTPKIFMPQIDVRHPLQSNSSIVLQNAKGVLPLSLWHI